MTWPSHFPPKCPPEKAANLDGQIYRLISGNFPKKKDFQSYCLQYPNRNWGGKTCQACGLSVHTSLEDCLENYNRLKRRIPSLRKKIAVARGNNAMGKILNTPSKEDSSHHTWWLPVELEKPWELFEVVTF
ncbi:hypothetical protein PN36_02060 [Candidatus Thiomargarita nelsonii]|uniref:Uncharacterized protein n=1 Tax=Candidatus Thiomargarita nelsonii TaxID=1003181 RepID=A0A0A6PDL1_9GAMM|nr:hypothetical protein PN36_02060 [Candidatus Thiomargarita nelsonii]